jgi:hypothetical protein
MTHHPSTPAPIASHNALLEPGRPSCGRCHAAPARGRHGKYCSDHCRWLAFRARTGRRQAASGAFLAWLEGSDGQCVLREVLKRAHALKARGVERYGIKALVEGIRYEAITSWGFRLALSNNHTARLARLVMDTEPELAGFFETRRLRAASAQEAVDIAFSPIRNRGRE